MEDHVPLRRRRISSSSEDETTTVEQRTTQITKRPRVDDSTNIEVAPHLKEKIKPHQKEGIHFLCENIIERKVGCILAHHMGLGKTFQIIAFIEIFLRIRPKEKVLIICPVNVLANWEEEFTRFMPKDKRNFQLFPVDGKSKKEKKTKVIDKWNKDKGVLIMGYEMFRILINSKKKKSNNSNIWGLSEEYANEYDQETNVSNIIDRALKEALLTPSLIICDEGHKIKNPKADITEALHKIKTKNRIVLTGYPLQNNLSEYYAMVNFVRPGYLGTKNDFDKYFTTPIKEGHGIEAEKSDKKHAEICMHILNDLVKVLVQRLPQKILLKEIPESKEYVICVKNSPLQKELFQNFTEYVKTHAAKYNALLIHVVCVKILNHPDLLYNALTTKKEENKENIDNEDIADKQQKNELRYLQVDFMNTLGQDALKDYLPNNIANSHKMKLAFELIDETIKKGEKILFFSGSLTTLNLIEELMNAGQLKLRGAHRWIKNQNYCRFDGKTSSKARQKIIDKFNSDPQMHLFLISTKAGSLGINLVAATRAIIFDVSWNPCHDAQAVCRIIRYGQKKKTFIYRLVADNSVERVIFNRQIYKLGLQHKIVDGQKVDANVKLEGYKDLINFLKSEDSNKQETQNAIKYEEIEDDLLKDIVRNNEGAITKTPFLLESSFVNAPTLATLQEKNKAAEVYQEAATKYNENHRNIQPGLGEEGVFGEEYLAYEKDPMFQYIMEEVYKAYEEEPNDKTVNTQNSVQHNEDDQIIPEFVIAHRHLTESFGTILDEFNNFLKRNARVNGITMSINNNKLYKYSNISIHLFDNEWKLHNFIVNVEKLDQTATASKVWTKFEKIMKRYSLKDTDIEKSNCVVSTNKMSVNFRQLFPDNKPNSYVVCWCNLLHIISKRILTPYKRGTTNIPLDDDVKKELQILSIIVKNIKKLYTNKQLVMLAISKQRWMNKAHRLTKILELLNDHNQLQLLYKQANDSKDILECIQSIRQNLDRIYILNKVLSPIHKAIVSLEDDKTSTLNLVLPTLFELLQKFREFQTYENQTYKSLGISAEAILKYHFMYINEKHQLALLLDPINMKKIVEISEAIGFDLEEVINNIFKEKSVYPLYEARPMNTKNNKFQRFKNKKDSHGSSDQLKEKEVDDYFDLEAETIENKRLLEYEGIQYEDCLSFWKDKSDKFPTISKLAKRILSIPASSSSTEKLLDISESSDLNPKAVANIIKNVTLDKFQ